MTIKVQMQSKNHQMIDDILKEQKKYRVVDKPKFPAIGPSIEIKQMPGWFFKTLVIAIPIITIVVVAGLMSLYQKFA